MAKSNQHQINLAQELKNILSEYSDELNQQKEIALDKAADFLVDQLRSETPINTGRTRNSWSRTTKYKGVRYIGNSATTNRGKNKEIPITNLLEFGKNGKPFIRRTFDNSKNEIIEIIKREVTK